MDDFDTCVKLEMTKIRSRAGPMRIATYSGHISSYTIHYFVLIWRPPSEIGVLFRGVAIAAGDVFSPVGSGEQ